MPAAELQRQFALDVLQKLRGAGYTAYWAGGCVRDQLLGRMPKDYDVATNATPDQIRSVFGMRRTLAIGAAFGVIAVIGPKPAGQVEVTTFRRDAQYSDGRHPDGVTFSSPEDDAQRRDFTINGLFYDPLADQVIDYVGGRDDLACQLIRAIGDPYQRFHEDKLRMLRAVRFAATYGFALDPSTEAAIEQMAGQILVVSPERIAQEMRLMLVHPARAAACRWLRSSGLLAAIFPEAIPLANLPFSDPSFSHDAQRSAGESFSRDAQRSAERDVGADRSAPLRVAAKRGDSQLGATLWDHTLAVLDALRDPSFVLALGALLHRVGQTSILPDPAQESTALPKRRLGTSEQICLRWRLSNEETERIVWLVRHRDALRDAPHIPWPKLQRLLISAGIEDLLALQAAQIEACQDDPAALEFCRERLRWPTEQLNPPPLLTGDDLISHGIPRGKIFKTLLDTVRDAQLERTIGNKTQALALVDQLLLP